MSWILLPGVRVAEKMAALETARQSADFGSSERQLRRFLLLPQARSQGEGFWDLDGPEHLPFRFPAVPAKNTISMNSKPEQHLHLPILWCHEPLPALGDEDFGLGVLACVSGRHSRSWLPRLWADQDLVSFGTRFLGMTGHAAYLLWLHLGLSRRNRCG